MSRHRRERRAARRAGERVQPPTDRALMPSQAMWASLGLLAAVSIAYWPVHRFGFVRLDDPLYVTENPHVLEGLTWRAVWWSLTSSYAANWHPVTWMSHMLDVQLFGFDAGAHHMTNVILHGVTTALLFGVLLRMTGALWPSFFTAGLFGLHPIHVESVAWIAERKDVLSALFWMLTLWAYDAYARHPKISRYIWVLLFFALGLMAKPMVVTLPFVLLLLDVWPLQRLDLRSARTSMAALLLEKLPLFALSATSAVVTFVAQREGGAVASSARLPMADRLGNAALSYVAYLEKTVWPEHLAAYYPYRLPLSMVAVAISMLALIVVSVGAMWASLRRPYILVGWLWYVGTLVPAIGIVQVGTQAMADRYSYLPLIGIFIILAWTLHDFTQAEPRRRAPTAMVMSVLLVLSATVTRRQVEYWKTSQALWTHALAVTSDNYAAHTYLGNSLATAGNVDSAIAEYSAALRIRPDFPEAHNNLGPALASKGQTEAAISQFTAAIRLRPNYADAHNNLGVTLARQGKLEEAIAEYREVLRIDHDHPRVHGNLGLTLQALGRTAEAQRELSLALQMNPSQQDLRAALNELRHQPHQP